MQRKPRLTRRRPLPERTRHYGEQVHGSANRPTTLRGALQRALTHYTRPAASIDRQRVPDDGSFRERLKDRRAQMAGAQAAAQQYAEKLRAESERAERSQYARDRAAQQGREQREREL